MLNLNVLVPLVTLVTLACASTPRGEGACTPVPADQRGGIAEVYRRCEVDTEARLGQGMPRPNYTPSRTTSCARATVEMVVDDSGRVRLPTVKVVRSNEQGFTDALVATLPALRFTPAQKGGKPVAQLVSYGMTVASSVRVVGTSAGTSGRAPRPAC